jgi:AraC family transcriptional activator of pobA
MPQNNISISQFMRQGLHAATNFGEDIIITNALENVTQFKYPCRIDAVTILFCIDGEINCSVNLKDYNVTSGGILVNFPENIIQIHSVKSLDIYAIVISSKFISNLLIDSRASLNFYLEAKQSLLTYVQNSDLTALKPYYDLIKANMTSTRPESSQILKGLVSALLFNVMSLMHDSDDDASGDSLATKQTHTGLLFQKFINLLTEYHNNERSVKFYASQLCITSNYLSLLVRQHSAKSPSDWINAYVTVEAKAMLLFSGKTVKEVAYALHFPTQSSFGKYFKQQTGISPKKYRDQDRVINS